MELLSKLRSRYDNIADVTECAQHLREKGNDADVVLNTPGLRRRFGDATGTERDLTKLPGWPEAGAHADKLRQYLAGQQIPGGQQFLGGQQFPGGQQISGGQAFVGGQAFAGGQQFAGVQQFPCGQQFAGGQAVPGGQQFPGGQSFSGVQQFPGGQQFLPCPMCPGRIPCDESRQGLLMICHCKHQPAEAASKDK